MGSSPRQAKSPQLVEKRSTGTEKGKCKIFTVPYWSTPISATLYRPGVGSTPEAICAINEWIPRSKRFSGVRAVPSSRTVRKRTARIVESSTGIAPVPRASSANGGGRGGVGAG